MSQATVALERFWVWTTFSPWFPVCLVVAMISIAVAMVAILIAMAPTCHG